ncbi:Putative teichuronic acid biosynthesis glycosyltransferase TuaC [Lacunisphaera limnophila]|uniref:Teichuronic acid biosynthesis glycosyltransferase TuaC n=1 Tax=Lacunisphaera limnophila TaxID=1838286 RepID=A0A1D8AVN2_9BACT|nr:glycosyltransferase family 4 protein [Lacunisphaera limnophila]AOS44964.1 Putative teichuronic acid biosynthesis glycosyltransferase TuaC [Lacunisphaera limnophila]
MHELAHATLHFDPPYPGLVGGSILHGWLVPRTGHHFTDVRVVAGDALFPGVYGIPRRDLAEYFKSDQPYLLAGFSVTLNLPAGRYRLTLEACTLAGAWEAIDTVERDVTAAEATPDPEAHAPLSAPMIGETLGILLRRLAAPGLTPAAAATALIRETPPRHHLQHPPRPFHGHLDQPHLWAFSLFGRLPLTGWVFHESLPLKRVFATTDLLATQDLKHGRGTPFLLERPGTPPHAAHAGYDGFLDLPAQLPRPATVRVYAELEDGSWHLGSVARFTVTDQEFAKQAYAAYSPLRFWCAWRALAGAIQQRGWTVPSGPDYRATILTAWRDYRTRAPRPTPIRPHPPARAAAPTRPGVVHLISHNLNQEGAPLFLLEYARHLRTQPGVTLQVTSAKEGPLRAAFEALGATVRVVDPAPLYQCRDAGGLRAALRTLAADVDLSPASLVVANTLSGWWGVHLARLAGRPALLYIHESTPPRAFFHVALPASAVPVVEETFRLADRVSFLTPATRHYYTALSDGSNYCLHPGWIDLARIDAFRATANRDALRTRLGLTADRRLVINVGTVCERKGQHLFARAVAQLWRMAPELAATADFLMIGGRDTPYDRDLADFIRTLGRTNLRVVPETGDVYPYYGAADLFVCSSYEESFPRVVLEAMAFSLPILSTAVHGIPEIVRPDREALLVPPGDSAALAAGLQQLLASPATGRDYGAAARTRVAAEYDSAVLLPRHLTLARSLGLNAG